MKKFAPVLAIITVLAATPALAQDTGSDLGGAHVGVLAGYDNFGVESAAGSDREGGVLYGVTAGYDIDSGTGLIGIEVEASETSLGDDFGSSGTDLYGGVRLGMQVGDTSLVYIKGGYSNLDVSGPDNLEGVRLGTGFERHLDRLFVRIEYRYTTYNSSDVFDANINSNRHQIMYTAGAKF